jgi:two-component sensor histidine kinase/sensor domain CHASE-containing protein
MSHTYRGITERVQAEAKAEARAIANYFEPVFSSVNALGGLMETGISEKFYKAYALNLLERHQVIERFSFAPDGVVQSIVPDGKAWQAIGLDLLNDPVRSADARLARDTHRLVMTGPYELQEGGAGLTARYPVYIQGDNQEEQFWGFVVAVIYMNNFFKSLRMQDIQDHSYYWELRAFPPCNAGEEQSEKLGSLSHPQMDDINKSYIFAAAAGQPSGTPVYAEIPLTTTSWIIGLAPSKGWQFGLAISLCLLACAIMAPLPAVITVKYYQQYQQLKTETKERKAAEYQLKQLLAEKDLMMKEIHHRVKNNLLIIESIISLQANESNNNEVQAMFAQLSRRIHSVSLVHDKLYKGEHIDSISSTAYFTDLLSFIKDGLNTGGTIFDVSIDDIVLSTKPALALGLILTELCTNAVKHGNEGRIYIFLHQGESFVELGVENDGSAPKEDYMSSPGLGLRLVQALCMQHKGELQVSEGPPVRFSVRFPISVLSA